jgi:flagellar biosynthesis component FlhA
MGTITAVVVAVFLAVIGIVVLAYPIAIFNTGSSILFLILKKKKDDENLLERKDKEEETEEEESKEEDAAGDAEPKALKKTARPRRTARPKKKASGRNPRKK